MLRHPDQPAHQGSLNPAGKWHLYNVASTSMQRHDVASTLRRRCINVIARWDIFMFVYCSAIGSQQNTWIDCEYMQADTSHCISQTSQGFSFDVTKLAGYHRLPYILVCVDVKNDKIKALDKRSIKRTSFSVLSIKKYIYFLILRRFK